MKEIKFRVYSRAEKKFYYWGFIGNGFVGFPNSAELTIEYCRKYSQEYIGSKDKNEKEIYNGDIVRTDEAGWIAKVIWNDAGFMCIDNKGGFSADCWWERYEVIGNMDENPELLGGKK